MFRPSDDATVFPFLVPSNFLLLLAYASSLICSACYLAIAPLPANEALADEVAVALQQCAIVQHPKHGVVYAFEVDDYGSVRRQSPPPVIAADNPVYIHTRRFALST